LTFARLVRARSLDHAAVGAHAALLALVAAAAATSTLPPGGRLAAAAAATAPLVLAFPGLRRGSRRARQWVALLLVLYIGAAIVEVVASSRRALPALVLLAALVELALLVALSRFPARPEPSE
jgi:uncharacterized membrane protein